MIWENTIVFCRNKKIILLQNITFSWVKSNSLVVVKQICKCCVLIYFYTVEVFFRNRLLSRNIALCKFYFTWNCFVFARFAKALILSIFAVLWIILLLIDTALLITGYFYQSLSKRYFSLKIKHFNRNVVVYKIVEQKLKTCI